jgi:hypothetical protein
MSHVAGEPSSPVHLDGETPARRLELPERDGVARALVAIASALGIEAVPRDEALGLIEAQLGGAEASGTDFRVLGTTRARRHPRRRRRCSDRMLVRIRAEEATN